MLCSFRRLREAAISRHSDRTAALPLRLKRSIRRLALIRPKTGPVKAQAPPPRRPACPPRGEPRARPATPRGDPLGCAAAQAPHPGAHPRTAHPHYGRSAQPPRESPQRSTPTAELRGRGMIRNLHRPDHPQRSDRNADPGRYHCHAFQHKPARGRGSQTAGPRALTKCGRRCGPARSEGLLAGFSSAGGKTRPTLRGPRSSRLQRPFRNGGEATQRRLAETTARYAGWAQARAAGGPNPLRSGTSGLARAGQPASALHWR